MVVEVFELKKSLNPLIHHVRSEFCSVLIRTSIKADSSLAIPFVVVVGERSVVHIVSAFTLEYALPIQEFLVKDHSEHKGLVEGMSLPTVIRTKVWVILIWLGWGLVHKQQLDN